MYIMYIVGHDVSTSTWCDLGTLSRVANDTEQYFGLYNIIELLYKIQNKV
jgi:hypothetical protein